MATLEEVKARSLAQQRTLSYQGQGGGIQETGLSGCAREESPSRRLSRPKTTEKRKKLEADSDLLAAVILLDEVVDLLNILSDVPLDCAKRRLFMETQAAVVAFVDDWCVSENDESRPDREALICYKCGEAIVDGDCSCGPPGGCG